MNKQITGFLIIAFLFVQIIVLKAQNDVSHPTFVSQGTLMGVSKALKDVPPMTPGEFNDLAEKLKKRREANEKLEKRSYPFASTALPKGPDPVWQQDMGKGVSAKAPLVNFDGQTSPYYPPDCNGTAGPGHFMQTINSVYAIYSKTGTLMAGPANLNTLFGSVPGATYNDGDPIILYDEQADRWLVTEFSISGTTNYLLVAVSTTNNPTGTWYQYSFTVPVMPDYPKFGIWRDGYYVAVNNSSANDIFVINRTPMLTGGTSQIIGFDNPNRPTSIDGFMCVPPVDNDGTFAPAGAPGTFIAFNDDAIGGGSDQLWIYELTANWTTPASSTFSRVQQISVAAFNSNFGNDWTNIAQQGTSQQLDAIPQVIMNVPQYRNFGTYQTLVCCHTVDVDNTDHAGVRWYELRRGTQTSGNWSIRQQGTYAPDLHSRWMASIMLNGSGKLGLGYSISSSTLYPGIRYTGQSAAAYSSATGLMDVPESVIQTGAYSQTGAERWGDYSLLSIDPADDQTFWFTTEYIGSGSARKTKIASFKIGNAPVVATTAATSVTATTATLNGTVNPNGLATNYYFEWGTTVSYGNTTTTTSAGSGSGSIAVSAGLTSLTSGVTYHFRIVATNADGTSTGSDLTFAPGLASVTTTAASSVTMTSATSGGNVITDGGSAVIARGVCWATTANPVATGNHTTDGNGTGIFTSNITGLSSNTTYHVRAYATNAGGTVYGADLTFTTTCGVITTFPWSEGFENGGVIPNCWSQEQVASSGINWVFITGNGTSNPSAAHGGTYNACLKDVTAAANVTRLITPSLNLSSVGSPTLTFWHYQEAWSGDQDILTVYYRTSATGTWVQLATYTSSVAAWTQRTISLPSASSDYYINFEGSAKWGYGVCIDDVSITGSTALPTITTTTPSAITSSAASGGGEVTSAGGASVTARGVCWATTANPVATGNHTTDGSGTGVFTSSITGLSPNTLYHVRAYATNSGGTAYGSDLQFTTLTDLPVVTTAAATSITGTTATSGGNVTSAGGGTISARGVCWSISANPVVTDPHTSDGTGTGTFTSSLSGLLENTSYHIRAYATNGAGTSYGSDLQFATTINAILEVTPAVQSVSSFAGSVPYNVVSNTNWTASSNAIWCTVTPSGTGTGTLNAGYGENTGNARSATITVSATGATPVNVTLNQQVGEPSNFATGFSAQNVTLHWTDAIGAVLPSGYLIRMSSAGFAQIQAPVDGTPVMDGLTDKNVAFGIQSASFQNLLPNTTYYFKLYAFSGAGNQIDYKLDGTIPQVQVTTAP